MKHLRGAATCLVALVLVTGCASTKVSDRQQMVTGPLPRPGNVWVYTFAASAADVPSYSELAGQATQPAARATPEEEAIGRKLGTEIAAQLVKEIRDMGLPGQWATAATQPQVNDIVIRGYLVSVDQGSAAGRMIIGFGAGGSELRTVVEGYQMTPQGLRKVGSGTVDATGSKTPGGVLGAATFLATGSPIGLIVGGGLKVYGEASGSATVEGRAKQTAKEIGAIVKKRAQKEGWI